MTRLIVIRGADVGKQFDLSADTVGVGYLDKNVISPRRHNNSLGYQSFPRR